MLGHALDHHAWDDAESIIRALDAYWDTRGLSEEATAWADRVYDTGPGNAGGRQVVVAIHHRHTG